MMQETGGMAGEAGAAVSFEHSFRKLSGLEKLVLQRLALLFGATPVTEKELIGRLQTEITGTEVRLALLGLYRAELIELRHKLWGERLCVLPLPVLRMLAQYGAELALDAGRGGGHREKNGEACESQARVAALRGGRSSPEEEGQASLREAGVSEAAVSGGISLGLALFDLFFYASAQPLERKKDGAIVQKHLRRLEHLLPGTDSTWEGLVPAGLRPQQMSLSLAVLLDMGLRLGIMASSKEAYQVKEALLEVWLSADELSRQRRLYELWCRVYWPVLPFAQQAALRMECLALGEWTVLDDIVHSIEQTGCFAAEDIRAQRWVEQLIDGWLRPCAACGWFELSDGGKGPIRLRRLLPLLEAEAADSSTEAGAGWLVLPDFTVLVPPDCPMAIRWKLASAAELIRHDTVSIYRLSRESVQQACESGRDTEHIIGMLDRHSQQRVPEPVAAAIRSWTAEFSRVRLTRAVFIRFADAETADWFDGSYEEKEACERLGDTIFAIPLEAEASCRAWLAQAGLGAPLTPSGRAGGMNRHHHMSGRKLLNRQTSERQEPREAPVQQSLAAEGLLPGRDWGELFMLEPRRSSWRTLLYPELGDIPSTWLQEPRNYHASTRRQMLHRALEWQVPVELQIGSSLKRFIPLELVPGEADGWFVEGVELGPQGGQKRLSPEHWEQMRLILPGINDINKM
ncbi:helicase-associated domain-containing protein [Paenibacillus sp. y28]|uniref:helicase-associated domain-containing protein n=1 Tax=Paenibacillus sp. y28 TaxID=3129110 RepID=UPI003018FB01